MRTPRKQWTDEDCETLRRLRPDKTIAELSKILNRTERSVKRKLKSLSITVLKRRTEEFTNKILNCETVDQAIILCKEENISITYIDRTRAFSLNKRYKILSVWENMMKRCFNIKNSRYHRYGARGITVCNEWKGFEEFYKWSKISGYKENLQIDRIDNDGNYCPENCRWVTRYVNVNNKTSTRFISAFGETKCVSDWLQDSRCVVTRSTLYCRFNKDHSNRITNEQKLSFGAEEYKKLIYPNLRDD